MLTVGSLFSGIGGLDLGLERAGMKVIWQSEIDPFACKVLKKHWPEVVNHGDIKEINWQEVERPDVICGGYPCQPFSTAGKRRGEKDDRHLWPWVRNAISELRPRYAILENVRGHLSLGGTTVIGQLAELGYDAEWRVVSAASVGANHRRDRIIIVAYPHSQNESNGPEHEQRVVAHSESIESNGRQCGNCEPQRRQERLQSKIGTGCSDVANADSWETSKRSGSVQQNTRHVFGRDNYERGTQGYAGWQWWETEPDVGRVAHGIPNRVDRLRGLGNAVVPQVAEVIGRLVVAHASS